MLARWNYGLVLGASPGPPDPQGVSIELLLGDPQLCWQEWRILLSKMMDLPKFVLHLVLVVQLPLSVY